MNNNEEIRWSDIWEQWNYLFRSYPSLNEKQEIKDIVIPIENCPSGNIVRGIDWIELNDYEKRIDEAVNHTIEFLLFSGSKNKGTLTTAMNLKRALNDPELTAGIWIYATTFDLSESLPEKWRGTPYRLIDKLNSAAYFFIRDKIKNDWHHAMRSLVPDVYFTYSFMTDYTPTSLQSILELIAINSMLLMSNYKIVYYKTAGDEE